MALQPHPRDQQYRRAVHAAPHSHLLGTWAPTFGFGSRCRSLCKREGRGTPRDTTEGLDQDTCWSDHPDPYHTTLGGLLASNSEPKGDIDVLEKSSSPDSVGEGAMPAEKPSAGLPASSGAALLRRKSHQTRKGLA